jgi:superfamily II DNA or RNA helicase
MASKEADSISNPIPAPNSLEIITPVLPPSPFHDVLASLSEGSYAKGIQFEKIAVWWLKNDPTWSSVLDPNSVKLWEESPLRTGPDIGIDITAEGKSGETWAIQAKNWLVEKSLPKSEVDKFLTASNTRTFDRRLLISTTRLISRNARQAILHQEKPCVIVDFQALEDSPVWNSYTNKLESQPPLRKKELRPHQVAALNDVVSGFRHSERGQLIMACGSGKTITAQRISEEVDAEKILVLVPSLLLVQQTLEAWCVDAVKDFRALAICSDLATSGDASRSHVDELSIPSTTDVDEIRRFLELPGRKVIFSTYQSSDQLSKALLHQEECFDLVLADEAHKLTGASDRSFSTVLDDERIPRRRTLFLTATPRIISTRVKKSAEEQDLVVHSMDDEAVFGPVFHRYSFASAIRDSVLTDYRVVVMGVTDADIGHLIKEREYLNFDGEVVDARTLAAHLAIEKAVRDYGISKMITFHSRVDRAREFAERRSRVISHYDSERFTSRIYARAISGAEPMSVRKQRLRELSNLESGVSGVLANAKCLTEGVDVPSLDGIAFIDPRASQVDIVQAVGRAIRLGGESKKLGYIVVPVFIEGDLEDELSDESFKPVWDVINALKSHDEELEDVLDAIRRSIGRGRGLADLGGKIILDFPSAVPENFAERIMALVLDRTTPSWEGRYGELLEFSEKFGHARPRKSNTGGDALGSLGMWVTKQRTDFRNGKLSEDRSALLESLHKWSWEIYDDQWLEYFEILKKHAEGNGSARVSSRKNVGGRPLGKWVAKLRSKKEKLESWQIELLEALPGWTWAPFEEGWQAAFEDLVDYEKAHGNVSPPAGYRGKSEILLETWVKRQRRVRETLEQEQVGLLETIPGWSWNPYADSWNQTRKSLEAFVQKTGTASVPSNFVDGDGLALGQRIVGLRSAKRTGSLPQDRLEFLESLPNWTWNSKDSVWDLRYDLLKKYFLEHEKMPGRGVEYEGEKLGQWVKNQREFYRDGQIAEDRFEKLNQLSFWTWSK